ncbi:hypothetical protein FKN01_26110 [Streptomyces sp. 130]|uniref:hypothetical protein n=1 Tax=Streptomyces sp. 130 TaxID=2591006 RepID=UPI00117D3F46|nr:hypothetical protein [Streptomyces sp. 130]TRV73868.1 hypothetical protein FKN01_26110 [Streptomyces sp. 130]
MTCVARCTHDALTHGGGGGRPIPTLVTGCRGRVGTALTALPHRGGRPARAFATRAAEHAAALRP